MGSIVFACVSPHPPILVHEVGMGRERAIQKTIDALEEAARRLAQRQPETVILISPHGPLRADAFGILTAPACSGTFAEWGAPQVAFAFENDLEAVDLVRAEAGQAGLPLEPIARWREGLDWGCTVPLYYLRSGLGDARLVPMTVSFLPPRRHFALGQAVGRAIHQSNRRVAIIASADLSHSLTESAPNGYDPMGAVFDEKLREAIAAWDVAAVLDMEEGFRYHAAEDAVPSVSFLMGALDGLAVQPDVLSYEGPFGVGYLVAAVEVMPPLTNGVVHEEAAAVAGHPLVRLAKDAVDTFVRFGRVIDLNDVPAELQRPAGAFVSIKRGRTLRGCIGTVDPAQDSLAREVVHNAIDSATRDPRFLPVEAQELDELSYSVDVLSPPEPVSGPEELDHRRYGLIVRNGLRRGLLLPDIEGVSSVDEQIAIARVKGGILPEEPVELFRFTVQRLR
ncbi:MAG TPA: AmmeMemoRadiSam system protein A [Dehalococcoidia bacterium]|nr:AmmeMemoRadiSam system protein A [Dehalococcoidia bacterium]